ncbi:MAG: hypothetical protein FWD27_08885 [Coriobacteriia bacterium]|nr:hypothetical protein [Coriobacteriia bacterium]
MSVITGSVDYKVIKKDSKDGFMREVYYKPSGKVSPLFIVLFIASAAIAIPILSVAYIYAIYYIPFIYLNFLLTGLCGLGMGFVIMMCTRLGKARSRALVIVLTILAMLLLKYAQWCVYIPLVYSDAYQVVAVSFAERLQIALELFFQPYMVLMSAVEINEFGVWGIGSLDVVNGIALLVVWILEFAIMLICALLISSSKTVLPFSENAGAWYTGAQNFAEANLPADFDSFKTSLEMGNFSELLSLAQQGKQDDYNYLGIEIFEPPPSNTIEPHYLTIYHQVITFDKKGEAKPSSTPLLTHLAADQSTVATIVQAQTLAAQQAEQAQQTQLTQEAQELAPPPPVGLAPVVSEELPPPPAGEVAPPPPSTGLTPHQ